MTNRRVRLAALAVGALILAAGIVYAVSRPTEYRSTADLLLAPREGADPAVVSSLLESFQRSGTSGTFVELVSSEDTLRAANAEEVEIDVRAVPDARTITVSSTGDREAVQPALTRVVRAAQARQQELGDVWELELLGGPSEAAPAGPSTGAIIAAAALLGLLGATLTLVVFGRYRFVPVADRPAAALGAGGPDDGASASEVDRTPAGQLEQAVEPRVHLDLQSFRYVRASPTTVLLQVTGYWRASSDRALAVPTLLLHDGRRMHPMAPLAAGDAGPAEAGPETPLWRESYAAPVEIFDRTQRIALRAGPGVVVGLPTPVEQPLLEPGGDRDGHEPERPPGTHATADAP